MLVGKAEGQRLVGERGRDLLRVQPDDLRDVSHGRQPACAARPGRCWSRRLDLGRRQWRHASALVEALQQLVHDPGVDAVGQQVAGKPC